MFDKRSDASGPRDHARGNNRIPEPRRRNRHTEAIQFLLVNTHSKKTETEANPETRRKNHKNLLTVHGERFLRVLSIVPFLLPLELSLVEWREREREFNLNSFVSNIRARESCLPWMLLPFYSLLVVKWSRLARRNLSVLLPELTVNWLFPLIIEFVCLTASLKKESWKRPSFSKKRRTFLSFCWSLVRKISGFRSGKKKVNLALLQLELVILSLNSCSGTGPKPSNKTLDTGKHILNDPNGP